MDPVLHHRLDADGKHPRTEDPFDSSDILRGYVGSGDEVGAPGPLFFAGDSAKEDYERRIAELEELLGKRKGVKEGAMFVARKSRVKPAIGSHPIAIPLDILLALQGVPSPSKHPFNLVGAIAMLLGHFGPERAARILKPRLWAGSWSDDALNAFITAPFQNHSFSPPQLSQLRVSEFPGVGTLSDPERSNYPRYDIVHFVGFVSTYNGDPVIHPGGSISPALHAGGLRDALVAARIRLLILQNTDESLFDVAQHLAGYLVYSGGPSVLCVDSAMEATLDDYFTSLYASIVHNRPLSVAAKPKPEEEPVLRVHLHLNSQGDRALLCDGFMKDLEARLRASKKTVGMGVPGRELLDIESLWQGAVTYSHKSQTESSRARIDQAKRAIDSFREVPQHLATLASLRGRSWDHEYEGAVPLSMVADAVGKIEDDLGSYHALYRELKQELNTRSERAPRVLNANFADPRSGRVVGGCEGLVADEEYDLLVDVGPRWNTIHSLVTGNADFPEHALPRDHDGYRIQVVLVSDQLMPRSASAWIWLPRRTGRSYPYANDERAGKAGPVSLRVRAPEFRKDVAGEILTVRGRLCLYYQNNLLQSAAVRLGVVRTAGVTLDDPNTIDVDYVLTGTFEDVGRFEKRAVQFGGEGEAGGYPVAANLTLNDDGTGAHRILVKNHTELPPGWMPYDPLAAKDILGDARGQLGDCYWTRDEKGNFVLDARGGRVLGLSRLDNHKTRDQFKWDMLVLAQLGAKLFNLLFNQVQSGSKDQTNAGWVWQLRQALADRAVIQIARTTPANYVFPWALVYEHPLPGPTTADYQFCPIIDAEWSAEGLCSNPGHWTSCPNKDKPYHQSNILCPYAMARSCSTYYRQFIRSAFRLPQVPGTTGSNHARRSTGGPAVLQRVGVHLL